jgi:hypothetical protein
MGYERRLVIDEDLAQPWTKDKEVRKATPSLTLTGTESGGRASPSRRTRGSTSSGTSRTGWTSWS